MPGLEFEPVLRSAQVCVHFCSEALGFIPPVHYPEETPGSFSWITAIFPASNAVSLIRVYSGSLTLPFEMIIAGWSILIVIIMVFAVLTVAKARWREKPDLRSMLFATNSGSFCGSFRIRVKILVEICF